MSLLTAAELAELHDTYEEALIDTCQLKVPVEATVSNQTTKTWPAVTSTVACAVLDGIGAPGSSEDYANSDLPNSRTVMLPRGTTVGINWHIVTGSNTYDVLNYRAAGSYGPAVQCECVEVEA